MNASATRFYTDIPVFDDFSKVVDDSVYRPMPDDWFIGLTDVADSTKAIEGGKYKSVNMAGASLYFCGYQCTRPPEFSVRVRRRRRELCRARQYRDKGQTPWRALHAGSRKTST